MSMSVDMKYVQMNIAELNALLVLVALERKWREAKAATARTADGRKTAIALNSVLSAYRAKTTMLQEACPNMDIEREAQKLSTLAAEGLQSVEQYVSSALQQKGVVA